MDFIKQALNQVESKENKLYDYIYNLVLYISIKESEENIKNNEVMNIKESKERLMQKYGDINIK